MTSTIDGRADDGVSRDPGRNRARDAVRALGIGAVLGAVYAGALVLAHLVWDDADVGWDRIAQRAVFGVVVLPLVFGVAAAVRSSGAPRPADRMPRSPLARIGVVLALLAVVALVALRSYSRMAT